MMWGVICHSFLSEFCWLCFVGLTLWLYISWHGFCYLELQDQHLNYWWIVNTWSCTVLSCFIIDALQFYCVLRSADRWWGESKCVIKKLLRSNICCSTNSESSVNLNAAVTANICQRDDGRDCGKPWEGTSRVSVWLHFSWDVILFHPHN